MADIREIAAGLARGAGRAGAAAGSTLLSGLRAGARGVSSAVGAAGNVSRNVVSSARDAVAGAATRASQAASGVAAAAARDRYVYTPPTQAAIEEQQKISERLGSGESPAEVLGDTISLSDNAYAPVFSVIIPTYEPMLRYFERTLNSVLMQSYGQLEILVADISLTTGVPELLRYYQDQRIRYLSMKGIRGRAAVMNEAARQAVGDYVLRVESGDLLTRDALFELFMYLVRTGAELVYTDEDKGDISGRNFHTAVRKPGYNKDYLLSSRYTGQLLVIRRELFLALRFRSAYEGALGYDLMLRAPKSTVGHIARVLYHRTDASAAGGRGSEKSNRAAREALMDYFRVRGIDAEVRQDGDSRRVFIDYKPDIFSARSDVGIVGGKVLNRRHRIIGGMMDSAGNVMFEDWDEAEGGPEGRALAIQDAVAVDVRCMKVRPELTGIYREIFGDPEEPGHLQGRSEEDLEADSLALCRRVRELGYLIVWDPRMIEVW